MIIDFTIDFRLPSLNDVNLKNRANKYVGAKFKKDLESEILACLPSKQIEGEYSLFITWYEPTKKRDIDNVYSSVKFILDAMVSKGIVEGDNPKYLKNIVNVVKYNKVERVEVKVIQSNDFEECYKEFISKVGEVE